MMGCFKNIQDKSFKYLVKIRDISNSDNDNIHRIASYYLTKYLKLSKVRNENKNYLIITVLFLAHKFYEEI